jgi:hypothetical protein
VTVLYQDIGDSSGGLGERPHQGLAGRITPRTAWEAIPARTDTQGAPRRHPPQNPNTAGTFTLAGVTYKVDGRRGLEQVLIVTDGDRIAVADLDGEILIEHTRPAPGITYVGNGLPRGPRPKTGGTVTDVLTHQLSPMS